MREVNDLSFQWLKSVAERSSDVICVWDPEFNLLYLNEAGRRLVGFNEQEPVNQMILRELFSRDDQPCAAEFSCPQTFLESRGELEIHFRHLETGKVVKLTGSPFALTDESKQPVFYAVAVRNVSPAKRSDQDSLDGNRTARREQVESVQKSEEDSLAEQLQVIRGLHELGTKLLVANDLPTGTQEILNALISQIGADKGTIQFYDAAAKGLRFVAQKGFDPACLTKLPLISCEYHSTCGRALQAQSRVIVEDFESETEAEAHRSTAAALGYRAAISTPLAIRSGEIVGMITTHFSRPCRPTARDLRVIDLYARQAAYLMERARTEDALRSSEERFRSLVSVITDVPWTTDAQGAFITPQPAWSKYTGQSWDQMRGFGWAEAIHPGDRSRIQCTWQAACRSGTLYESEARLWHQGTGCYRYVVARALPLHNSDGQVREWVGTCTDVEDQKRATEKLEQTVLERTAELREMIGELEAFSYSVSHDMRSPLRAMQGFSYALLDEKCDSLDEEAKDYLRRIHKGAKRLDLLIQDILSYSRVAKSATVLTSINLDAICEDIARSHPDVQESNASIDIQHPLHSVLAHEAFLAQIFSNLLSNAVKFVAEGKRPVVTIRSELINEKTVRLWVEDNGIGISPDHHDRIFKIFGRVYPEKIYPGTGIGLSIVKKAVQRLGGNVGFESKVGEGSKFWFTLQAAS